MEKILKLSKNAIYASIPYLKSFASLDIKESVKAVATGAQEHYYQYNKLVEEIEKASIYYGELYDFNQYVSKRTDLYKNLCTYKEFENTFIKLETMLLELSHDGDIRKMLDKQQKSFNDLLDIYHAGKVDSYTKKIAREKDEALIKSWPNWYRFELNAMINSMNIALDDIMFEISVYNDNGKQECRVKPKIKLDVAPPKLTKEEELLYEID